MITALVTSDMLSTSTDFIIDHPFLSSSSLYLLHPGLYFSGDEAHRDADGHYSMMGRVDDVMNPKGHRLESAEVEDALVCA